MKAILIDTSYKYDKVTLPVSGVEVSGIVVVRSGKVHRTVGNINCTKDEKNFSFSLNQPDIDMVGPMHESQNTILKFDDPTYATPSWPAGISVDATVEEFKQFVITDINS